MSKVKELLSSLGMGEDGLSVAYPDSFNDDITAAYDEDFSVPTAKIGVLEQELAVALAKIDELKAHNYDLLMQVPAVTPAEDAPEENQESEDSEPDELDDVFS